MRSFKNIALSLLFLFSFLAIELLLERTQSAFLFASYSIGFGCYLLLCRSQLDLRALIGIGLLARLLLFLSMPSLSDDVYRFLWDGTLLANGIHPFSELPSFYLDKSIPGLTQELYSKLNSPDYFTIYPPINQLIFWLSVVLGGGNWLIGTNLIRFVLLLADLASLWFLGKILRRNHKSERLALLFFLNPLVILEFVGNVHFEGLVVCFVLGGIYWLDRSWIKASLSLGVGIGTKLLPLIFLPFLFINGIGNKNKQWVISIAAGLVALATIAPMINQSFINGMTSSVGLYFQKFEFNASIYFLAREVGYWIYGYNAIGKIGPLLSILTMVSTLILSAIAVKKRWPTEKAFLFILTSYLFLSTTVHPWYLLPLIAYGILSGYYFPIVWSFVVFVTYLGYSSIGFELPLFWVLTEYLIVLIVLIFELKSKKWVLNPI